MVRYNDVDLSVKAEYIASEVTNEIFRNPHPDSLDKDFCKDIVYTYLCMVDTLKNSLKTIASFPINDYVTVEYQYYVPNQDISNVTVYFYHGDNIRYDEIITNINLNLKSISSITRIEDLRYNELFSLNWQWSKLTNTMKPVGATKQQWLNRIVTWLLSKNINCIRTDNNRRSEDLTIQNVLCLLFYVYTSDKNREDVLRCKSSDCFGKEN